MDYIIFKEKKYFLKYNKLNLANLGIKDIDEIKGLKNLTRVYYLDLSGNEISLIKGLDNLINILELDLSNNKIQEIKNLNYLIELKELHLTSNELQEIKGLDKLKKLTTLWLSRNSINEIKGLSSLKKLENLSLFDNRIEKIQGLESLKNLKYLSVSKNKIERIENLENLTKIVELYLNRNAISVIEGISYLERLQLLQLNKNNIANIEGLDTLKVLWILDLSHNNIEEIKGLNKLQNLKHLNLSNNRIYEIKGLENSIHLESLDIWNNFITNSQDFVKLLNFKSIIFIDFDHDKIIYLNPKDKEKIKDFLWMSYQKTQYHIKYTKAGINLFGGGDPIAETKRLYDKMIGIASALINLYGVSDKYKSRNKFYEILINPLDIRISMEKAGTNKFFELEALKHIIEAGLRMDIVSSLSSIERAIEYLEKAGKVQCSIFYQINCCLIKSQYERYKKNYEESRKQIDKILKIKAKYKNLTFNEEIRILIDDLPGIQYSLLDTALRPDHWNEQIVKCGKKFIQIFEKDMPRFQLAKPGLYRIMYNILKDMEKSWNIKKRKRKVNRCDICEAFLSINPESNKHKYSKRHLVALKKKGYDLPLDNEVREDIKDQHILNEIFGLVQRIKKDLDTVRKELLQKNAIPILID